MKKIIFKWFSSFFQDEIRDLSNQAINEEVFKRNEKERTSDMVNYPLGTKVIIVGNEPTSELLVAEVVDFQEITRAKKVVPVFKNLKNNKEFISMGHIHYWSKEKEKALRKLSWDERYNVSTRGIYHISKADIDRKNSKEYLS